MPGQNELMVCAGIFSHHNLDKELNGNLLHYNYLHI